MEHLFNGRTAAQFRHFNQSAKWLENNVRESLDTVAERLEDSRIAARRLLKRGRYAVENGVEDTAQNIRRNPFGSLTLASSAGVAVGFVVSRVCKK